MKNKYWKLTLVSIFILSFTIFSITAFRTITWWDLGNYSLAAVILGVPSPPGSLLLVILGWLITKLPLGITRVFSLNLFAGFLAALTVTLTAHLCIRLTKRDFEDKKVAR